MASSIPELITEINVIVPWVVLLIVFAGGAYLHARLIGAIVAVIHALDGALGRQQTLPLPPATGAAPAVPTGLPPPLAPTLSPPVARPAAPVLTDGAFAGAPPWFIAALHEIGFRETGDNQGIGKYIALAHTGSEGDPWCAIFANAMLESVGVPGTRSPSSQSFRSNPGFIPLQQPALGALAVFWRGTQASGLGHVAFYRGEDADHVWGLGGNESDMVQIEPLAKAGKTFGLIGYWWPRSVALPTSGPVIMPTGSPSVKTDPTSGVPAASPTVDTAGWIMGVTATMEGGPGDPETNAYTGKPVDDNVIGVSFPFRYSQPFPAVRIRNSTDPSKVIETSNFDDVGPWLTNDDWLRTGRRPAIEALFASKQKTALGRVPTNNAAIDLTVAAASALGIDGKGRVDVQLITPPATT